MSTPVINTPTIGRRVWYWPSAADFTEGEMKQLYSDQPFDAGVTSVHAGSAVGLDICDHMNGRHGLVSVPLLQADDVRAGKPGTAQWMPYQAAQAKKTEAALAQAAGAQIGYGPGPAPLPANFYNHHEIARMAAEAARDAANRSASEGQDAGKSVVEAYMKALAVLKAGPVA